MGHLWFVSAPTLERDVYVATLRSAGFDVDIFSSAAEARGQLRIESRPNVLILDLLPEPEHAWLLVQKAYAENGISVIIFTALVRPDRANRILARQLGCAAFVAKPCSPLRVLEVAHHVRQGAPYVEVIDYD